jgi:hypothetical protein
MLYHLYTNTVKQQRESTLCNLYTTTVKQQRESMLGPLYYYSQAAEGVYAL